MLDTVIIPGFSRPEFFHLCLELIAKSHAAKDHFYLFAMDHLYKRAEYDNLINDFAAQGFQCEIDRREPTTFTRVAKQSYNILTAYKHALERTGPENLIYLVEEDIFVANDFFMWHRFAHQAVPYAFCVIATRNHNAEIPTTDDLKAAYVVSGGQYQSLGVSFTHERLAWILGQVSDDYFTNPMHYCQTKWPGSIVGPGYCEQDGLLRRIQEANIYPTVFPHVPRAYHAGFYGKNRGRQISGTLPEKVSTLRSICFSEQAIKEACGPLWADSVPVPLINPKWW